MIFLSLKRDSVSTNWKEPINLGYPINDHKSQNSLIVSSDGKTAYFNSSLDGYGLDDIFYFDLPEDVKANKLNNIELDIIVSKPGEEIILNNVQFANNSFELNQSSKNELDKLSNYIFKYNINIQIEGHTDSVGNSDMNLILSENRARAVNKYLIERGVSKEKLTYIGYGSSKPIADNSSENGRALNRRTSFKILE